MGIEWIVSEEDPDISVVIPSLPEHEVQGSAELQNQLCNSYEVLIVRDGSLDICEARNAGIEAASAEYIALTDDDTRPPYEWVSTALDRLREGAALIEGPILKVYDERGDTEFRESYRRYVGCNLAFREDVWVAVGGFDSQFAGWADDTVFGWEVENQFGLDQCRYDRGFCMYHIGDMRSPLDQEIDNRMRRTYPERYFSLHRSPSNIKGQIATVMLHACHMLSPRIADELSRVIWELTWD